MPRWEAVRGQAAEYHVDEPTAYLLFQTLLGSLAARRSTASRRYMEKAVNESKEHTSWNDPDARYEFRVGDFAARCLDGDIAQTFARVLAANEATIRAVTLAAKLLQLTLPGVPDIYQGNEILAPALVDPDNRRPVDYAVRAELLAALDARGRGQTPAVHADRASELDAAKLWVTTSASAAAARPARGVRAGRVVRAAVSRARRTRSGSYAAGRSRRSSRAGRGCSRGRAGATRGQPAARRSGATCSRADRSAAGWHGRVRGAARRPARGTAREGGLMAFRVWAPRAESAVALVLDGERHALQAAAGGWWESDREAVPGAPYAFAIDDGEPRADPRALSLPDGPEGPAAGRRPRRARARQDDGWRGLELPGAVIYELHVGTFTPAGTLDSAIDRLDHLVELGVGIVEVMPLATFPGGHGWGYDGVGLYAVHEAYGGPFAFRRFIDACHARGLAVCLDVVYNHLGPSGNHLAEFGPYFTGPLRHAVGPGRQPQRAGQRRGAPLHHRQRPAVAARLRRRRTAPRRRARAARRPRGDGARGADGRGRRALRRGSGGRSG